MAIAVTLIALKRRLPLKKISGFFVERMSINNNWRQVTVLNNHLPRAEMTCENHNEENYDTHGKVVQSPLVVLKQSAKRRRLFLWQVKL